MARAIDVGILGATGAVGQQFVARLERHPWFTVTWLGGQRAIGRPAGSATCPGGCSTPLPGRRARPRRRRGAPGPRAAAAVLGARCLRGRTNRSPNSPRPATSSSATRATTGWTRTVPLAHPRDQPRSSRACCPPSRRSPAAGGAHRHEPELLDHRPRAGARALAEFGLRTRAWSTTLQARRAPDTPAWRRWDLLGNVIPFIDGEEQKIECETNKILGRLVDGRVEPHPLVVSAPTTRVPVLDGHTELVSVAFENSPSHEEIRRALARFPRQAAADAAAERPGAADSAHGQSATARSRGSTSRPATAWRSPSAACAAARCSTASWSRSATTPFAAPPAARS